MPHDDFINMLPIAYAHHKMIYDEMGDPCDYEFIEANKAFEQMTSLKVLDIIGKKVSKVLPSITDSKFNWIKQYGEIVLKNLRIKFDAYSEPLGKWYRVFAYSPQKDCFTTLFFDITDIVKKSEEQEIIYKMLNDIIFEMDENYYFSNILCADESILFIPKEETIGKNIQELLPKDLATSFIKAMEKAKCSGEKVSVSYHSIKPSEDKWFEANIKFACINDKLKYIISISDITEKNNLKKNYKKVKCFSGQYLSKLL